MPALLTLLSQTLISMTIEFDGAFEQRMPHRTARGPAANAPRGPWLVSRAMWDNALRWVPEDGIPTDEFAPLARLTNANGLRRWGYIEDTPRGIAFARGGRAAARTLRPLGAEIETRWLNRLGSRTDDLRDAVAAVAVLADGALPWFLPVLHTGSLREVLDGWSSPLVSAGLEPVNDELSVLLARAVMVIALRVEARTSIPLQISSTTLRVLTTEGVSLRTVPEAAGISREAAEIHANALVAAGLAEDVPGGRGRTIRLTDGGVKEQNVRALVLAEEEIRLGPNGAALRRALESVWSEPDAIRAALVAHPEGWRANPPYAARTALQLADPARALPQYPVVSHRGGFPDGS